MRTLKELLRDRKTLAWMILAGIALGILVFRIAFPPRKAPAVSVSAIRAEKGLPVTTLVAEKSSLDIRRSYYGLVRSVRTQEVTSFLREMVESVKVEVGDRVRAGDVLAVLSGGEQAAAATADRASVEEAKRDVERMKTLYREGAVSRAELEQSVVRLKRPGGRPVGLQQALGPDRGPGKNRRRRDGTACRSRRNRRGGAAPSRHPGYGGTRDRGAPSPGGPIVHRRRDGRGGPP